MKNDYQKPTVCIVRHRAKYQLLAMTGSDPNCSRKFSGGLDDLDDEEEN